MRVPNKNQLVAIPQGGQSLRHGLGLNVPAQSGVGNSAAFERTGNLLDPISQGLNDVVRATQQIAFDVAAKQAEAQANDAYASLGEDLNRFLYDGESGIFARKGERAVGSVEETKSYLDQGLEARSRNLSPAADRLFRQQADRLRFSTMGAVARHAGVQLEEWRNSSFKASMATDEQAALSSYNDDRQWDENLQSLVGKGRAWMTSLGCGQEEIDLRSRTTVSQLTARRIGLYAESGDFENGFRVFKNAEMNPEDRAGAAGLLERAYLNAMMAETREDPKGVQELADARKKSKRSDSPKGMVDLVSPAGWERLSAMADAQLKRRSSVSGQELAALLANRGNYISHGLRTGDYGKLEELAGQLHARGRIDEAQDLDETRSLLMLADPYLRDLERPLLEQEADVRSIIQSVAKPENSPRIESVSRLLSEEMQRRKNLFQKDPAGYVAAHPSLRDENLSLPERIERSVALQERIGAGMGFDPHILTADQAMEIRDDYEKPRDWREKAGLVKSLVGQFGNYALPAMNEAGLPLPVVITAPVSVHLSGNEMARWVMAAETSWSGIALDENEIRKIKREVNRSDLMLTMEKVWKGSYTSVEQGEMLREMRETLQKYVAQGGRVKDIAGKFHLANDSGTALMVPKDKYRDGTEIYLERVRQDWLSNSDNLHKFSVSGQTAQAGGDTLRSQIANGLWSYDAGSDGYVLLNQQAGTVVLGTGLVGLGDIPDMDDRSAAVKVRTSWR